MTAEIIDRLKEAVMLPGVSGYEDAVREYVRKQVGRKFKLEEDAIGNLRLRLGKGKGPAVGVVAHMDEVGMLVSSILDNGYLKFRVVGGIYDQMLPSRGVEIHTSKGRVNGVIGFNAPHLNIGQDKKEVMTWDKLFIDVGARSREEVEKMGIRLLDQVTLRKDFFLINERYVCSRALDNRVGVTALLALFRELGPSPPDMDLNLIWTVQEEIGLRGATVIANSMDLDYVIALDTYSTTDCPGLERYYEPVLLGNGPVLRMVDARMIASPRFRDMVMAIAKRNKIPVQYGVTGGSTDGMAIQGSGALTLPMGIPMRYTHSSTEVVHLDDLQNLVRLLSAVVRELAKKA